MSVLDDIRPSLPWEGPPLPRILTRSDAKPVSQTVTVKYGACEYGLECLKGHMLRAHLFMTEAIRFSSGGTITPEAQAKVRLAREQLLCEDDFQAAMDAPPEIKAETLKLLASARATWKAIDKAGLDNGHGTVDDLNDVAKAITALSEKAYQIDARFRVMKEAV